MHVCVVFVVRQVLRLIAAVDAVVASFGHPRYHAVPLPHVSVAWCAGAVDTLGAMQQQPAHADSTAAAAAAAAVSDSEETAAVPSIFFAVDRVCCTAGNKRFVYELNG